MHRANRDGTIAWRSSGQTLTAARLATSTQRQNDDRVEVEAGREEEAAVRAGSWLARRGQPAATFCRRACLPKSESDSKCTEWAPPTVGRKEFDGCQEDPESDEGANCAAESGGRGQAVRVGWSGHFPGRAIEGRGARPVGRAVRTAGRPLRVGPAGRSGGRLHGRAGLREAGGAATGCSVTRVFFQLKFFQ